MSKNKLQVYSRLRINAVFQLFLFLFWLPRNIRSSQAKDQIRAAVATYTAAAATHCAGLGMEPTSWRWRDAADPIASQQELPLLFLTPNPYAHIFTHKCTDTYTRTHLFIHICQGRKRNMNLSALFNRLFCGYSSYQSLLTMYRQKLTGLHILY